MTESTLKEIVRRAVSDAAFRGQLRSDPGKALAGIGLSADERAALTSGDPARLAALGVDQRMSKAFVIGGADGASKVVIHDPDNVGTNAFVSDEASGSTKSWDSNLRTNEANIDATAFAPAASVTTWDAHLRTNEGNINTSGAQDPDATSSATALEPETTGVSTWNAHLGMNEGTIDTGSAINYAGDTVGTPPQDDVTSSDTQLPDGPQGTEY